MGRTLRAAILAIAIFAVGCGTGGRSLQLGTETSFDGLIRIERTGRSTAAWIHPDFDLSGYQRIKLEGAGIEYRPVPGRGGAAGRQRGSEFPMSETAQQQLEDIVTQAFDQELARSERFELTAETGPDVLLVWGGLLDVVSFVPPEPPGSNLIFLQRVGEATLIVELRDSQSNATLARIADRRAAQQPSAATVSNTATNTAEVRRLARRWARRLREILDDAPALRDGRAVGS